MDILFPVINWPVIHILLGCMINIYYYIHSLIRRSSKPNRSESMKCVQYNYRDISSATEILTINTIILQLQYNTVY